MSMGLTKRDVANQLTHGQYDWTKVEGQEFTWEEARQAQDFADLVESYGITDPDQLSMFLTDDLPKGVKLYLAVNVPQDQLGVVLLNEDDQRILEVAKERCNRENNQSSGGIWLGA